MIRGILEWLTGDPWEYGAMMRSLPARRHKRTGEVQVATWKDDNVGAWSEMVGWSEIDPIWWRTFERGEV